MTAGGRDVPHCSISAPLYGDVSVFFSGGLDSTAVALMAGLKNKGRVHLLTLDHGYGYLFRHWAETNVPALKRALGQDRVVHRFVDTRDLFRALAVKPFLRDLVTYKAKFGVCMGCTMALTAKAVIYNLENGIPHIMMGSSVGGTYAPQSMPVTVSLQKRFCARYGILYSTPLLDDHIVKEQERALLASHGVWSGVRFLDKHSFGNQGYCLPSVQHLPDVLFNLHPNHDPDQVGRFYEDKVPACHAYIADHFQRTGQDMDALVQKMRDRIERASGGDTLKSLTGGGEAAWARNTPLLKRAGNRGTKPEAQEKSRNRVRPLGTPFATALHAWAR